MSDNYAMRNTVRGGYRVTQAYYYASRPYVDAKHNECLHYVKIVHCLSNHIVWRSATFHSAGEANRLYVAIIDDMPAILLALSLGLPVDFRINNGGQP